MKTETRPGNLKDRCMFLGKKISEVTASSFIQCGKLVPWNGQARDGTLEGVE